MTVASLPTLFGRFTALQSDQRMFVTAFRTLQDACGPIERSWDTRANQRLNELFSDLLASLSRHFAAEEEDGYFGTIMLERPSLRDDVLGLEAEHAAILTVVATLAHFAAEGTESFRLRGAILRCARWLQAHEQREAQLLREFLLNGDREQAG